MKELARERVQNYVHSSIVNFLHDTRQKAGVSIFENMVSGNSKVLDEVINFFWVADCTEDLEPNQRLSGDMRAI
jgi:hypothetical protein